MTAETMSKCGDGLDGITQTQLHACKIAGPLYFVHQASDVAISTYEAQPEQTQVM